MRRFLMLSISLGCLAACAGAPTPDTAAEQPDVLFLRAQTAVRQRNYEDAHKLLERVRDEFPFSKFAVDAELLGADAAFEQEKFEEAAAAYKSFEDLHPTHPRTPYAMFRRGKAQMALSRPEDRDQTATRAAAEAFQKLLHAYPDAEYAKEARALLAEARGRLAAHELYVARFYVRTDKADAALGRLEGVVRDYPDTPSRAEAEALIAQLRAQQ